MEVIRKNPRLVAASVAAVLLSMTTLAVGSIDCGTVDSLISTCTTFITYGSPEPDATSPCCNSLASLHNLVVDSTDNRRSSCHCLVALITNYNSNITTVNRLPGLCGISLSYTLDPNTDCDKFASLESEWKRRGVPLLPLGLCRSNGS